MTGVQRTRWMVSTVPTTVITVPAVRSSDLIKDLEEDGWTQVRPRGHPPSTG